MFHVPDGIHEWNACTERIIYSRGDLVSYYVYPRLIKNNLKIVIYTGNTDAAVPSYGTVEWVN